MNDRDSFENQAQDFENQDIEHLKLFLYLLPVFGFFPALWTLYRRRGSRQERSLSRLVIKLALGWFVAYFLIGFGVSSADSFQIPLMLMGSLLTSGYFLVNLWLMARLWQRKAIALPLVGRVGRMR
ncbi:MAG: hypothetical protein HC936_16195 [Leptolyngbyaceae cyanobacterium SU_3_3]|nr:hypothetical protein [Leptolyngbyaceae cyanobacterium SU_3_3]